MGGTTRKWVSPGCTGVPDRIVILPWALWLVEVKTSDGTLSSVQDREHRRLRGAGAVVRVVYGHAGVDELIEELGNVETATTA